MMRCVFFPIHPKPVRHARVQSVCQAHQKKTVRTADRFHAVNGDKRQIALPVVGDDFKIRELRRCSGKTAQFEIELRSLAEKVTPAPDEAFAKSLGFDSLDALKADLRAKKQKIHEEGADRAAGKQLLDMAGANMTVDLPAEILDRTAQNEMKLLKERLSRSGITLEQHCKNSRTTPEALEKDYRAQAESRIRFVLAARAIAEAENIVVHPEEVNAEYRRLSQLQDTPEAEIRKALPEDTIAAALAAKKVQRFLLDNAQVTTVTDAPEKE